MITPVSKHSLSTRSIKTAKHAGVILIGLSCCWLLWEQLSGMDFGQIKAAIKQVTFTQWSAAGLATWASFHAIGRYDANWHRLMATSISADQAHRVGVRAIALSQFLGFGAITSSLVRWRSIPELSLWKATQLSVAVTVTFILCWAVYALAAVLWIGQSGGATAMSFTPLLLIGAGVAICIIFAWRIRATQLGAADLGALFVWTGLDLVFASLALYLLLPDSINLLYSTVLTAYIIALGLGLASNAPGGVGAFDLALITLLPTSQPESLVATIIAFRIVYYALPALIGLWGIARPASRRVAPDEGPAHWGLAAQSGELRQIGDTLWHTRTLPLLTCSIGARSGLQTSVKALGQLFRQALQSGTLPALYNCDARTALAARNAGWTVKRTAMEAIIRPQLWSIAGRRKQTLRRKLRLAEAAGVTIELAKPDFNLKQLKPIAHAWALAHGGQYGFSMGSFDTLLLRSQKIVLIRQRGTLIGFLGFHATDSEWCLDLIRHISPAPDGAVHAAIAHAISQAQVANIQLLSLASVPDPRQTPEFWSKKRAGLIQFKRNFDPIWVGRYHAAPNAPWFWISGVIIAFAVHRPLANFIPWSRRRLEICRQSQRFQRFRIAVPDQT